MIYYPDPDKPSEAVDPPCLSITPDTQFLIEKAGTGEIYKHSLSLPEAVIAVASYDGHAAMFVRDAYGVMSLRVTVNHVSTVTIGPVSENPDDKLAIDELCAAIVTMDQWPPHMEQLHICEQAFWVFWKIEAWLLADTDEGTGPGTWLCELSDDKAWLSYRWPVDAEGYNGDEPWTEWGGNAFLERNGLRVVNAWMIDGCDTAWIDLK